MRGWFVGSLAAMCLGFATCSGASCLSVLNFEPPHPEWGIRVTDIALHPESARINVQSDEYAIWIDQNKDSGACTLVVKDTDGKLVGQSSEGSDCRLSLKGHAGQSWTFEATSLDPHASINMAHDNPLFPEPLNYIAYSGAFLFVLALFGVVASSVRPRHGR